MELNEKLKDEIANIFSEVQYGRIIFFLNPEKKKLNYVIETSGMLDIEPQGTIPPEQAPKKKLVVAKYPLDKNRKI